MESPEGTEEYPSLKQVLKKRFEREKSEAASKGNVIVRKE